MRQVTQLGKDSGMSIQLGRNRAMSTQRGKNVEQGDTKVAYGSVTLSE